MNLHIDTTSIFPMNGAGKEGLTIAGKELVLHCIADYTHSLASSSRR